MPDDNDAATGDTLVADTRTDPRGSSGDKVDTAAATNRTPRVTTGTLHDYQLGEVLGRGGMGEVIAAHDPHLEREVALKRMRDARSGTGEVARFVREAKIQARLEHPAIVPVHALGTDDDGLPYFTMKRLVGTTLADKLKQGGDSKPLLRAFVDVCFAIQYAHERGIVHRDLKPSNIMFGDYNDVYVLDWGIARVASAPQSSISNEPVTRPPSTETATGAILGTPGYMAPEQLRGASVTAPVDVYSLGAILFEILSGETLHPLTDAIASTLGHVDPSPSKRKPERTIAPELDAACTAALHEDPLLRPTARQLAERVQLYLDGDRDLALRRSLVAGHVAAARLALDANNRADAIRRAGRALAIDPDSREAAEIVTKLIVQPPKEPTPELQRELDEVERGLDMQRSRRGALSYLAIWVVVFAVPFLAVESWPLLAFVIGSATVMAGLAIVNARHGSMPISVVLIGNLVCVVAFSRLAGPFVMTPMLACGIMLAIGGHRRIVERPWLAIAWLLVAIALPFVVEEVGLFDSTWTMTSTGLITHSTVFAKTSTGAIVAGMFALAIVVGAYTLSLTRARRQAQRSVIVQAWHLKQLLPRD